MKDIYTLITVKDLNNDPFLFNPRGLMGMNKDKALGSIKWWRKITARKNNPTFIYDPSTTTLFRKNGRLDKKKVLKHCRRFWK